MSALHTIEARWFPTTQPFALSDYFAGAHKAMERTDWYAVPCGDGSGVKIREGRLETKLRSESYGRYDFNDQVAGNIETWSKWSVELDQADAPTEAILGSAKWLSVTKLRYVRRFEITDNTITETSERSGSGCSFELTKLTVNRKTYWTTGFEAVANPCGPEPSRPMSRSNLHAVFDLINAENSLPSFDVESSLGYPEWLNQKFGCS